MLYVPELKVNLFSLGCALDKGYTMRSDSIQCDLLNKNGQVCATAKRYGKLYRMFFKSNKDGNDWNLHAKVKATSVMEQWKI